jgi:hypothetical protein
MRGDLVWSSPAIEAVGVDSCLASQFLRNIVLPFGLSRQIHLIYSKFSYTPISLN